MEVQCITPEKVYQYLEEKRKVLLVDMRSFVNYSKCHLDSSINLCVPSTLLKRENFSIDKLENVITCSLSKQKFQDREGYDAIIYDNECNVKKCPSFLSLLKKFSEDNGLNSVSYMEGGFSSFEKKFPSYCKKQDSKIDLVCLTTFTNAQSEMDMVLDYLYIGSQFAACSRNKLSETGITHILNCAKEVPNYFEAEGSKKYLKLPMNDCPSQSIDTNFLQQSYLFIQEAKNSGGKVLVHCFAGQSRSATIVLAYLMLSLNWSLNQSYSFLQEKRPSVSPNLGFISQLTNIERSHNPTRQPTKTPEPTKVNYDNLIVV